MVLRSMTTLQDTDFFQIAIRPCASAAKIVGAPWRIKNGSCAHHSASVVSSCCSGCACFCQFGQGYLVDVRAKYEGGHFAQQRRGHDSKIVVTLDKQVGMLHLADLAGDSMMFVQREGVVL